MGDRGNIVLRYSAQKDGTSKHPDVFLYTHWGGHNLPEYLAQVLSTDASKSRRGDDSYQAWIIIGTILAGASDPATGWGIAPFPPDNEYPYLYVDLANSRVRFGEQGEWLDFDELIDMSEDDRRGRLFVATKPPEFAWPD